MAALALPALLVSGAYLGAISHTLTALEALDARGISVSGIVLSTSAGRSVAAGETREAITRFAAVPALVLPRLAIGADGVPALSGAPDLTGLVLRTERLWNRPSRPPLASISPYRRLFVQLRNERR